MAVLIGQAQACRVQHREAGHNPAHHTDHGDTEFDQLRTNWSSLGPHFETVNNGVALHGLAQRADDQSFLGAKPLEQGGLRNSRPLGNHCGRYAGSILKQAGLRGRQYFIVCQQPWTRHDLPPKVSA